MIGRGADRQMVSFKKMYKGRCRCKNKKVVEMESVVVLCVGGSLVSGAMAMSSNPLPSVI